MNEFNELFLTEEEELERKFILSIKDMYKLLKKTAEETRSVAGKCEENYNGYINYLRLKYKEKLKRGAE